MTSSHRKGRVPGWGRNYLGGLTELMGPSPGASPQKTLAVVLVQSWGWEGVRGSVPTGDFCQAGFCLFEI